jgi:hypothetical protein
MFVFVIFFFTFVLIYQYLFFIFLECRLSLFSYILVCATTMNKHAACYHRISHKTTHAFVNYYIELALTLRPRP